VRERLGDKLGLLLADSLRAGGARGRGVTELRPQAAHGRYHRAAEGLTFPTDANLLYAAIKAPQELAELGEDVPEVMADGIKGNVGARFMLIVL